MKIPFAQLMREKLGFKDFENKKLHISKLERRLSRYNRNHWNEFYREVSIRKTGWKRSNDKCWKKLRAVSGF